MKTETTTGIVSGVIAASVLWCLAGSAWARASAGPKATELPYVLSVRSGATEFADTDQIEIASLRGDRPHLEPGGTYVLEGTYRLNSAAAADLAWFTTSRGPSGSTPVTDQEHVQVTRGSGTFHLQKTLTDDGWSHVTFYVNGHPAGGVYFGEQGIERTVLRNKGWSDFSSSPAPAKPRPESAGAAVGTGTAVAPANLALMAFLGEPVPAPAALDPRYTPTNLVSAFHRLSEQTQLRVQTVAVDESEFPFLVYGVLAGKHDFRELEHGLGRLEGYVYGGSVVGTTDRGSTYFSLNMIPSNQYPSASWRACDRRLMVRLEMLAERVRNE